LTTVRRAIFPPRNLDDSEDFCAWWSVFAAYTNAVFDVLIDHLLPAVRESVENARAAGQVYDEACAVFFKDFLPGIAAEIELSRDLLANVDSKQLLLARFSSPKVHLQAVDGLDAALEDAVPHLTDLVSCVYDEIGAVLAVAPLSDDCLASVHAAAAASVVAAMTRSVSGGWAGIVLLTRMVDDRLLVVDVVPGDRTLKVAANRISFYKSCRWMERRHYSVVNRALKILRQGL
jgi:hypothetical protein